MNEKQIRKLIRLVEESEIESLEVSRWGRKIKITQRCSANGNGNGNGHNAAPAVVDARLAPIVQQSPVSAQAPAVTEPGVAPSAETTDSSRLIAIKSPMVGTFYLAPSPDSDAYVSLNQKIVEGQVVCIVEAMKLMNEIEAEVSGRIAKILAENGKPVEFGQELFLIEPA